MRVNNKQLKITHPKKKIKGTGTAQAVEQTQTWLQIQEARRRLSLPLSKIEKQRLNAQE